jgi:uncharacterized protein (TIGR02145 family)
MKNIRFLSFWMFLVLGLSTAAFNSCSSKKGITARHDEGVIINGVKWATRNVDKPGTFTTKPEDAGMFYQWNRKIGWSATNPIINSNGGTTWDRSIPTGTTWKKANDPSPAGWRVPTLDEIESLLDTEKVTNERITENGVDGRRFIDKLSGNSIFLPAQESRSNDGLLCEEKSGNYWSSTRGDGYGCYFNFDHFSNFDDDDDDDDDDEVLYIITGGDAYRASGFSLRCVAK